MGNCDINEAERLIPVVLFDLTVVSTVSIATLLVGILLFRKCRKAYVNLMNVAGKINIHSLQEEARRSDDKEVISFSLFRPC